MKLFAVSDLHLPGNQDKPMDVFGGNWTGHFDKIKEDWLARVGEEDAVLIAGDISWAMTLPDALTDLEKMKELPGKKKSLSAAITITGGRALQRSAAVRPTILFCFCRTTRCGWKITSSAARAAGSAPGVPSIKRRTKRSTAAKRSASASP